MLTFFFWLGKDQGVMISLVMEQDLPYPWLSLRDELNFLEEELEATLECCVQAIGGKKQNAAEALLNEHLETEEKFQAELEKWHQHETAVFSVAPQDFLGGLSLKDALRQSGPRDFLYVRAYEWSLAVLSWINKKSRAKDQNISLLRLRLNVCAMPLQLAEIHHGSGELALPPALLTKIYELTEFYLRRACEVLTSLKETDFLEEAVDLLKLMEERRRHLPAAKFFWKI